MTLTELLAMSLSAILVENFVLVKFLGICPFLGVSKSTSTATGMGLAVVFVMGVSSACTWCVNRFILEPFGLEYMQTLAFILVIAALVQFVEMFLQKALPSLYQALGIYLPLITTNCAVLGVTLLNEQSKNDLLTSTLFGFAAALGFALALLLFTGLREKMDRANPPKAMRGTALALVTAGLLSLAFMGFSGLVKP